MSEREVLRQRIKAMFQRIQEIGTELRNLTPANDSFANLVSERERLRAQRNGLVDIYNSTGGRTVVQHGPTIDAAKENEAKKQRSLEQLQSMADALKPRTYVREI